jgi:hypothetical protein
MQQRLRLLNNLPANIKESCAKKLILMGRYIQQKILRLQKNYYCGNMPLNGYMKAAGGFHLKKPAYRTFCPTH